MDICCGEVVVKSKVDNKSLDSGNSNLTDVDGAQKEERQAVSQDIDQLKENIVLLQNQIDELAESLGEVSKQLSDDFKGYLDRVIKKERFTKRF